MGRQHFVFEAILVDHDFEVDVDVLAAGGVVGFLLLLFALEVLHLDPAFFSFLLDSLDLVERVSFLVLTASLHKELYLIIQTSQLTDFDFIVHLIEAALK